MRIEDKYKSKPKPTPKPSSVVVGSDGSDGAGDGESTDTSTASTTTTSMPVITSIHECVESGDLIGLQRLLAQHPFSLNEKSIFVSFFLP